MSPPDRRAAIIKAALPLLAEHGTNVTTSQIAAAAGIAEGTLFRVFTDKQALIAACVGEAMRPDNGLTEIRALPRDLDLPQRLSRLTHVLAARIARISGLIGVLTATGYRFDGPRRDPGLDREKWFTEAAHAVVELIGPDAGALRIPPERAAHLLLSVAISSQFAMRLRQEHGSRVDPADIDELVDVLLHGVLK
jgi:AcrR family transcriptional regulator